MMADIPQKLGKYEIRRELGRGAMGIVYEGWDPMIARRVALKTVRREQLDRSEAEEILSRFQREAQAAGRLNHPNVVAVYDFGEDAEGIAFIAMEYVEGKELKDYFDRQERFSLAETVRLMSELLSAIGHAHAHGIVHRDIKPANIFILDSGQAKVGDFGIARIESSVLTQAGSVLGTPAYMSPEQFMGQRVDGRSDIFSAGVILYQFLSGEKPFSGQLTTIMHKVLKEDPIAPSELNVQAPPAFDAVVKKAMAKRPEDRYQTAQEFIDALMTALENRDAAGSEATYIAASPSEDATVVAPAAAPAKATYQETSSAPVPEPAAIAPPPMPPTLSHILQPELTPKTGSADIPTAKTRPPRSKIYPAAAIFGVILIAVAGAIGYFITATRTPANSTVGSSTPPPTASVAAVDEASSKTMTISAVAYVDPSDPRFAADPTLLRTTLREESRRELIEKAVGLYVQSTSLSQNYAVLRDKLLAHSNDFIDAVLQEGAPETGKDGLVSMSAKATVRVRDVQKSLNQMSRDERIDFIRNNGDPKIAVAITTASAAEGAQPKRSQIAENVLKEKVQSFGFRTWNEEGGDKKADFAVVGEAKFKRLAVKLQASGLELERIAITSWTIKCVDKKTGEEIYFNTTVPQKMSWNSEDEALIDVGKLIGEEFSKNFFLQNFHFAGQKVHLNLTGLPNDSLGKRLASEISGLRNVLGINAAKADSIDIELSGGLNNVSDLVTATIAAPLNRKFGKSCFNVAGASGNDVTLEFSAECKDPAVVARLDSAPPASLYAAPAAKRQAIVKNPELLKKLEI
ncbi:MAG: serine/threonine protein kinase [Betaproteobacteria bacterium]